MYIETTFMHYGHGHGGIVGITLYPHALKCWAISLHIYIYSCMIKDVSEMGDSCELHGVPTHKEEQSARTEAVAMDRSKIQKKLSICIDPLNTNDQPSGIIKFVSGEICQDTVNVDKAISLGEKQMKDYEAGWPVSNYHK